jgi:hypothetical protein
VGGWIAAGRYRKASQGRFELDLQRVNRELAEAHAQDRGWERGTLEASARQAYAAQHDGAEPAELELVQVIDKPGTDEDKAVFRCGSERLTLGRRDGEWVLESLH